MKYITNVQWSTVMLVQLLYYQLNSDILSTFNLYTRRNNNLVNIQIYFFGMLTNDDHLNYLTCHCLEVGGKFIIIYSYITNYNLTTYFINTDLSHLGVLSLWLPIVSILK